ncbi:MAG: hypothetical protein J7J44_05440 [Deltaproteobacteria bacterium]|nr:hypothetical protein [Deltaproteobacteria bacterium]
MFEKKTIITKPNAEARDVDELFAGKIFRVPDYQRNYSWDKKIGRIFGMTLKKA